MKNKNKQESSISFQILGVKGLIRKSRFLTATKKLSSAKHRTCGSPVVEFMKKKLARPKRRKIMAHHVPKVSCAF